MKRCSLIAVCWMLLSGASEAALTADWLLQDNAASTTVIAAVGSNGTYTNAGNTSAGTAVDGPGTALTRSLIFDGTNDSIVATTGNADCVRNKAVATLCYWFKCSTSDTTASTHRQVFVSNNSGLTRAGISLNATGQILAQARAGDGESFQTKTSTNSYDDGSWHHVAVVFDYAGDAITIYVDGTSVAQSGTISFTATATSNTASGYVSFGNDTTANAYKGRLSRCSIYDSDESANLATIIAEKDTPGGGNGLVYPQIIGSLIRPMPWSRFLAQTPIALEAR